MTPYNEHAIMVLLEDESMNVISVAKATIKQVKANQGALKAIEQQLRSIIGGGK